MFEWRSLLQSPGFTTIHHLQRRQKYRQDRCRLNIHKTDIVLQKHCVKRGQGSAMKCGVIILQGKTQATQSYILPRMNISKQ